MKETELPPSGPAFPASTSPSAGSAANCSPCAARSGRRRTGRCSRPASPSAPPLRPAHSRPAPVNAPTSGTPTPAHATPRHARAAPPSSGEPGPAPAPTTLGSPPFAACSASAPEQPSMPRDPELQRFSGPRRHRHISGQSHTVPPCRAACIPWQHPNLVLHFVCGFSEPRSGATAPRSFPTPQPLLSSVVVWGVSPT